MAIVPSSSSSSPPSLLLILTDREEEGITREDSEGAEILIVLGDGGFDGEKMVVWGNRCVDGDFDDAGMVVHR